MKTNRQEHLDGVAGIMILYMIYGHICCWVPEIKQIPILPRLLFLFMPWFFFKSGMFYQKKSMKVIMMSGWKKLLIPYLVFSFIGDLIFDVRYTIEGNANWQQYVIYPFRILLHQGAVAGNSPLWFLLTLFFVRIIYNAMPDKRCYHLPITIIVGILAYTLHTIGFADYYWIANTLLGLFFYGIGHELSSKQYHLPITILATICYIVCLSLLPTYIDFRSNSGNGGNYIAWMLASLGGIIMFNNAFKLLPPPAYRILAFIGKHSMSYFVMHWAVMGGMQIMCVHFGKVSNQSLLFIVYFVAILTLPPLIEVCLKRMRCERLLGK